jgi:hypothetical protein
VAKYIFWIGLVLLLPWAGTARAAPNPYRDLVLRAFHAPDGKASADIEGAVAELIRQKTRQPDAVVHVDVSTLGNLPREDCKRFELQFRLPGRLLPTKGGGQSPLGFAFRMNLCADGQPPGAVHADQDVLGKTPGHVPQAALAAPAPLGNAR